MEEVEEREDEKKTMIKLANWGRNYKSKMRSMRRKKKEGARPKEKKLSGGGIRG